MQRRYRGRAWGHWHTSFKHSIVLPVQSGTRQSPVESSASGSDWICHVNIVSSTGQALKRFQGQFSRWQLAHWTMSRFREVLTSNPFKLVLSPFYSDRISLYFKASTPILKMPIIAAGRRSQYFHFSDIIVRNASVGHIEFFGMKMVSRSLTSGKGHS